MKQLFSTLLTAGLALTLAAPLSATADTSILATQNTVKVHSYDGLGCEDWESMSTGGFKTPGACVEYTISVENTHNEQVVDQISFNNDLGGEVVFIAARQEGFEGGKFRVASQNSDCDTQTCMIQLMGASLSPGKKGIITARVRMK